MGELPPAEEEAVEVVMEEKENAGEDKRKQERNLKDVISVHGSVTGLTVDLFFPGSTQRRDPSAPCPFAGKDLPCKLTKGSAIVKRDISNKTVDAAFPPVVDPQTSGDAGGARCRMEMPGRMTSRGFSSD
jgi:hypothetical protein